MSTALEDTANVPVVRNNVTPHEKSDVYDEKLGSEEGGTEPVYDNDNDITRPFRIEDDAIVETHQLTFRALLVGSMLGAVVGASNLYLGLKTGFTFGPQLFGAIFGFAILKPLSKALPESGILGVFGGPFGPKENCTVQSAATSAGGLGILSVSAIPAMYRMDLLSALPKMDIGKLISLNVCAGFFGVFFVIPLRKYYIVQQRLTFPTPAATAITIRALHRGKTGAIAAKKKSLAMLYTFCITFVYKVVAGFAPGLIFDWHVGWTLFRLGFTSIISLDNYGWWIEFTPAFFGAGMLSGINASWSFFLGSILAWGVIAPSLVKNGLAVGIPASDNFPEIISYGALKFADVNDYVDRPSPRYWLLWPGVLIMLVYSFVEVALSSGPMVRTIRHMSLNPKTLWSNRNEVDPDSDDPSPPEDQVPTLWWTVGLGLSTIMSCAILATQWHMNVGEAILALLLGFVFSFIAVQSTGTTDLNPVSTVAKASQLIFGGIAKGTGLTGTSAQSLNLVAGTIAGGSAAQSADMCGDLKTGYLLRAKPKNQFVAQLVGSVVAVFLTSGLFILFTTASPCILHPSPTQPCSYGGPSISAWVAVSTAVSAPRLPIPPSSGYTAIALSIFAAVTLIVRHFWIPRKYWKYIPNWNSVGLGFVVPQVYYSLAMAAGSILNWVWLRRSPGSYDMYMFAISAGLLAGEGLAGVFNALLAVAGVDGGIYGTAIGCPDNVYCG